jgi:RNA polymerase sigma-70 factor (ECF subfamily)
VGPMYLRARSAEAEAMDRLGNSEIAQALMELPETFRMTIYLADVEGYPYKEIAEIMGTPVGTVMSRLHRARGRLRDQLASRAPRDRSATPRPAAVRPVIPRVTPETA